MAEVSPLGKGAGISGWSERQAGQLSRSRANCTWWSLRDPGRL